jgi:hypothetical protein
MRGARVAWFTFRFVWYLVAYAFILHIVIEQYNCLNKVAGCVVFFVVVSVALCL